MFLWQVVIYCLPDQFVYAAPSGQKAVNNRLKPIVRHELQKMSVPNCLDVFLTLSFTHMKNTAEDWHPLQWEWHLLEMSSTKTIPGLQDVVDVLTFSLLLEVNMSSIYNLKVLLLISSIHLYHLSSEGGVDLLVQDCARKPKYLKKPVFNPRSFVLWGNGANHWTTVPLIYLLWNIGFIA